MANKTLKFPSTLAEHAENGSPFVRIEVNELQGGSRIQPYVLYMYMPIGFSVGDTGNYGTLDMGQMGAGLDVILQQAGVSNKAGLTQSDLIAGATLNAGLLSGIPFLEQVDKGARIAALKSGVALNPYQAVSYEGQQIRSFTFDFKLISESAEEARTAREIIDVLRNYHMPEKVGSLAIQYPAIFNISFYKGEKVNNFMPKITPCYLTNITTTYNPTGNTFHADGAPVETDLSLTFQETKSLTRQDLYGEEYEGIEPKDETEPEGEG
jgi:hypothetical protein